MGKKQMYSLACVLLLGMLLLFENAYAAPSIWDMDARTVRDLINQKIFSVEAAKPEVYSSMNTVIKNGDVTTPVRIYSPNGTKDLPVILFIHGGGWVAGNLETHDNLARYLCREAKSVVVAVDYRNSPEGKFPLPLEQCYDALLWIKEHGKEFHADATRIAVVGDSAGGNMAGALCLLARDRKGPQVCLQVLINPSPDLTGGGTLQKTGDALDSLRWFATQYLTDSKDANSPYVSPIVAKDLSGLPPAVILLAEKDAQAPDGQKYADRLVAAQVPTNVYTQWGIGHLAGDGARASKNALESLDVAVAALHGAFRRVN